MMKIFYSNIFRCVAASLALLGFCGWSSAQAATITLTPSAVYGVGDTVTVNISGAGFSSGTLGGGLNFTWAASVLNLVSATPAPGGFSTSGTASAGTLNSFGIGEFLTDYTSSGQPFNIGTLVFQANSVGSANLVASIDPFNQWVDGSFSALAPQPGIVNPSIQVTAAPIPPAVLLFGSGLVGLVTIARRKRQS